MSEEVQNVIKILEKEINSIITLKDGNELTVKPVEEIYRVRVEEKQIIVHDENKNYISNKRLYELESILGNDFFRICKSTIINLKKIDNVAPSLTGMIYIKLKNGLKTNITRKYLPKFKKYLGI